MSETVVRCGVEVCPTCGTVRANEAGEIRELRLKLLQAEEALSDQDSRGSFALQTSFDAQKTELQKLRADNANLLNDMSRLRIERDKALQSAAYAKAQYDALQEHFSLVNS